MFVVPAPLQMQNSHPTLLEAALSFQGAYRRLSGPARLSVLCASMFSYGPWEDICGGGGRIHNRDWCARYEPGSKRNPEFVKSFHPS